MIDSTIHQLQYDPQFNIEWEKMIGGLPCACLCRKAKNTKFAAHNSKKQKSYSFLMWKNIYFAVCVE